MSVSAIASPSMPSSYGISSVGAAAPKVAPPAKGPGDRDNDATETGASKAAEGSSTGRALNILA